MTDFEIPFDKNKALLAIIAGAGFMLFGYYLFQGQDTIELPYKFRFLFQSTFNAAIFILITGFGLGVFGLRRFISSRSGIVLNSAGFMDHRYLKAPIPWQDITGFDTHIQTIMKNDIEVLILQVRPGAKGRIRFNWNYKYNNWSKASQDELAAFTLAGMQEQDSYAFKQAFSQWISRNSVRQRPQSYAPTRSAGQSPGFGRRRS